LDSLKIFPKVGSSIVSKPNLSPPSLPHLLNLPNLPNLLNLLTQNATKAPSLVVGAVREKQKMKTIPAIS